MPGWIAQSRKPGQVPTKPTTVIDGKATAQVKDQLKAAGEAAAILADQLGGEVNYNLSGFTAGKDESGTNQIQIVVAVAE